MLRRSLAISTSDVKAFFSSLVFFSQHYDFKESRFVCRFSIVLSERMVIAYPVVARML